MFTGVASFHLSVIRLALFYANSKCQVAFIIAFCNLATARTLHFASFPVTFWLFAAIGVSSARFHTSSFQTCALIHCTQARNAAKRRKKGYQERQIGCCTVSAADREPSHSSFPIKTFCQARTYTKEWVKMRGKMGGVGDRGWVGGKTEKERGSRGCVRNCEWRQAVEKGKPCASPPAGSSKCNSWLGADTGAQSVFIGLQDFNPQYWLKPLAEGWWPSQCSKLLITGGGGPTKVWYIISMFFINSQFLHIIRTWIFIAVKVGMIITRMVMCSLLV